MMKKVFCIVTVITCSLCLASCDKEDNGVFVIPDESVIEEWTDEKAQQFFNHGTKLYESFFTIEQYDKDVCYIINSMEELRAVYKGTEDLPEIDFTDRTLVVGKVVAGTSGYYVASKELKNVGNDVNISVHLELYYDPLDPNYASFEVLTDCFYWGVYPKFFADSSPSF